MKTKYEEFGEGRPTVTKPQTATYAAAL